MGNKAIRYKVVSYNSLNGGYYSAITSVFSTRKGMKPYVLKYSDVSGVRVKATPDSMGIMAFKRLCDAADFISRNNYYMYHFSRTSLKVLRVYGIGRGHVPKKIYLDIPKLPLVYKVGIPFIPPPTGTICYPEIEVINLVQGFGV